MGLFVRQVIGGVLIGSILGLVFSRLTAVVDDHLIDMTLSTALAYGSYLIAQSAQTSGPLACVAAGLIHGSYGKGQVDVGGDRSAARRPVGVSGLHG